MQNYGDGNGVEPYGSSGAEPELSPIGSRGAMRSRGRLAVQVDLQ